MSIKKVVIQNRSVNTELDNAYQRALITGTDNKIEHNNKRKSPIQIKEWSILSDHVKYVKSDGSETFHNLNIDQMNYRQENRSVQKVARRRIAKWRHRFWW